ncbi:unnamed protein product [Hydatigera taeniaeformis]|uniref:Thioredoxin_16 domain-containing protein n=1 Tax=Hydatigena taeniaeformis TaxID=6205 RepID=A0A0R3XAV7_HYDTA|nr:unnamed protein product [Hydatigera taeniaeformis]
MYHVKPVVVDTDCDIVHTDNMYKASVVEQLTPTASGGNPPDKLACYFTNKSGARSKLGQVLDSGAQQQEHKSEGFNQTAEEDTFKAAVNTERPNEMKLDRYIIRKVAPASKLGKCLHSQRESGSPSDQHSGLLHRLKQMERVLDSLLFPMGLVKSSLHVSSLPKPTVQPSKHVEKPNNVLVSLPISDSVSSCASSHMDADTKLLHRLKVLDKELDSLLVPMGITEPCTHVSPANLIVSKGSEPSAQPTDHGKKPNTAPISVPVIGLTSSCASSSKSHTDYDTMLVHRLEGLDRVLDGLLVPMGLVKSTEHVPPSKLIGGRILEPSTQLTKYVQKPAIALISAPVTKLVSSPPPSLVDLAIHCDPKNPPFAILLYSKLQNLGGRNISLQFYKHSTLTSIPKHLSQLENFFVGQPRSSSAELILSVIWRPCALGCMAISNPFTDLPLYGETAILMFLCSLSSDFAKTFQNLSSIDSAVLTKNVDLLVDCVEKFGKTGTESFSIEEISLFVFCEVAGLSSLVQGASKSWFSRCMSNEYFAKTKKIINQYH